MTDLVVFLQAETLSWLLCPWYWEPAPAAHPSCSRSVGRVPLVSHSCASAKVFGGKQLFASPVLEMLSTTEPKGFFYKAKE